MLGVASSCGGAAGENDKCPDFGALSCSNWSDDLSKDDVGSFSIDAVSFCCDPDEEYRHIDVGLFTSLRSIYIVDELSDRNQQ